MYMRVMDQLGEKDILPNKEIMKCTIYCKMTWDYRSTVLMSLTLTAAPPQLSFALSEAPLQPTAKLEKASVLA